MPESSPTQSESTPMTEPTHVESPATTAFPTLDAEEMACVAEMGRCHQFQDGDVLFEQGVKDYSFFAIESGEIDIIETSSGEPKLVVTHGAGSFTGDVDMLTGRPSVITARARGECVAHEVAAGDVRRLLNEVPGLSDKLLIAFQTRRELLEASDFMGIRLVGHERSRDSMRLREFFHKNKVPHTFLDVDSEAGQMLLDELGDDGEGLPVLVCHGVVERNPSLARVAECLGISRDIDPGLNSLVIVGAGPAGLAACVYGASEGLKPLLIDRMGPGGQAGQSSKIENYMGFPAGIPGAELANRGYLQALKFGARFTAPVTVHSLERHDDGEIELTLCTGQSVRARSVLISTGANYSRLPVPNCLLYEGAGLYYSATSVEARVCRGATAIVVGGGNSAGQAAMYLSEYANEVKVVIRGDDLGKSMSDYLVQRIEQKDNIEVLRNTEVSALDGGDCLERVTLSNNRTHEENEIDCAGLFVFIGAKPHTDWVSDDLATDRYGFLLTGLAAGEHERWPLERQPHELETTCPGVFAAGDVRSGTTKRCGFAVGDGSLAITCVHRYLAS